MPTRPDHAAQVEAVLRPKCLARLYVVEAWLRPTFAYQQPGLADLAGGGRRSGRGIVTAQDQGEFVDTFLLFLQDVFQEDHQRTIAFSQAFGARRLADEPALDGSPSPAEPMTEDTIFDIASLTKPFTLADLAGTVRRTLDGAGTP